ncbi:phospholipase D/nuclease [Setomelanomma holmii]|uniref:Phospholipase D/nuclease n=1 Tax=Setomelanomma holmii TaxID=210430 RepID=A0A9P4GWR0_9PLEO|nr:phospholipase D/nuclease [Setomelanomma holmii]
MTRHNVLPPHVHPSIREVNDVLLGTGGIGYTICYVLMTRQSVRDRTYAMPLFSLAFNFAWEIVFALFVAVEAREVAVFTIWMLIDVGLVYGLVTNGANEWKHAPKVGRNIGKIFTGMLAWWCMVLYAVSIWWLNSQNPVNPKQGKAYKGVEGIDADELGYWTALVAQVVLSGMSLAQIMVRDSSRGSSYAIWTTRFVGSLSGLNMNYGYCWWVWPEAHQYVANPVAVLLMITWVIADLAYLVLLYQLKQLKSVSTNLDDDADLRLAMALSLQQSPEQDARRVGGTVDLTSDTDSEDEDMERAIALSLQEPAKLDSNPTTSTPPLLRREPQAQLPTEHTPASRSPVALGLSGLDRKTMEQERLLRLGKRKREPSPDRPPKQITKSPSPDTASASMDMSSALPASVGSYPRGVLKRTFATKFLRTDDITIEEVLQADTLHIAVISSFMWDSEWLNQKLDPRKVKQVWIMNAKYPDVQKRWRQEMQDCRIPNLEIHFPPMGGQIHSMHSKFMLLFGKESLRIVVPTANMTPIDWGEVKNAWQPGVMENSVFLIDLPRRHERNSNQSEGLTGFGRELVHFLEKLEVDQKVIDGVLKFDFSKTEHLAFVHSIGGTHHGNLDHPTGLPGLAQAVRNLQMGEVNNIQLDYAVSSIGAVNDTLLQRIHLAARGEPFTSSSSAPGIHKHVRIYFPTDETVQQSIGGSDCGGIISLTRQHYSAATFPRDCFRNYDSNRRGMLSHNKLLFARGVKRDGTPFAWVYNGSANISDSAWGGQKVLKSGQMGSLNIRNWECGVLVPVSHERIAGLKISDGEVPPMSVFEGTIEVPFVHPGQPYGEKQPWFFKPG